LMRFAAGMAAILSRRNVVQIAGRGDALPEGSGISFHSFPFGLVEEARRRIGAGWRLARREFIGLGRTGIAQVSQWRIAFALRVFGRSNLSGDRAE
jgi:hypothetical protein